MTHALAVSASATVIHVGSAILHRLAGPIDELHRATATPVTARRPWLLCWARSHDEPLITVTVHRDGELVAVAALTVRHRALWDEVRPLAAGLSDEVRLPVRDAAAAEELAAGISTALDSLDRPWRLVLRDLPPHDAVVERLLAVLPNSLAVPGDISPRMAFGEDRQLRAYVSRNHHQQGRRLRNRLEREGHRVELRQLTTPEEVAAVLPSMVTVCQARDLQVRGYSSLNDPRMMEFFRLVILEHAGRGEVRLTTLNVDGALAAYVLCFADGPVWRMWNCRFDPKWRPYGVGRLSHDASLAAALSEGAAVYDWMRGGEAYKDGLSNHVYRVVDVFAASNPGLAAAFEGKRRMRIALRDVKNRHPVGVRAWERIQRLTASRTATAGCGHMPCTPDG